jgi:hypothetical protein
MIHPICTTFDGVEVYVDLITSEAASNIAKQPQLLGLAKEVLTHKKLTGERLCIEQDMGRVIGYDFIVETPSDDTVFYAQVVRERVYTRFIKAGKPLSTEFVSVLLKRGKTDKEYELQDVRIGRLAPPRPGTPNEATDSKAFWATHAFVHDNQILQPRTITRTCPY